MQYNPAKKSGQLDYLTSIDNYDETTTTSLRLAYIVFDGPPGAV